MAYDDIPSEPPVIPTPPPQPPEPVQYETRNILNQSAQVIGQLSFPVGTPEGTWTSCLAHYSTAAINLIKEILSLKTYAASGNVTTSSSQASTIGGMTAKPEAGTYLAQFSGGIFTAGASAVGEFGIYVDDVLLTETKRPISCNLSLLGGLVTVSLNAIGVGTQTSTEVTLNGNQTIDVKFKSTNGGTIGFAERTFQLIKVK